MTAELAALRAAEFAALDGSVYVDAASIGPIPERSRRAAEKFASARSRVQELDEEAFLAALDRCRAAAARLIGAEPAEIALGANTSFGINLAAQGLPLRAGSCVVSSEQEFPANVYPWMAQAGRGVSLELIPTTPGGWPDEERILARLERGDVSALALSAVQFASGYRADLARLGAACRDQGIFFVVDAIQALGQVPISVGEMGIDILACGGQKWLCGPFGTGFAYVRRELQESVAPRPVGWTAMSASADLERLTEYRWDLLSDARRFEIGSPAFHDLLGLAHSIELLLEAGIERIERHLRGLLDLLLEESRDVAGLSVTSDLRDAHRSGILCLQPPAAQRSFLALREAGIHCAFREGAIRLSPHVYNTEEDMRRIARVLARPGAT